MTDRWDRLRVPGAGYSMMDRALLLRREGGAEAIVADYSWTFLGLDSESLRDPLIYLYFAHCLITGSHIYALIER
jgi:hypothetical protein